LTNKLFHYDAIHRILSLNGNHHRLDYVFGYRAFSSLGNQRRILFWRKMLVGFFTHGDWRNYCFAASEQYHSIDFVRRLCFFLFLVDWRAVCAAEAGGERVVSEAGGEGLMVNGWGL